MNRRPLAGLLCACAVLIGVTSAQAGDSWLRLQQLNADQLSQLKQRQRQDALRSAPLSQSQQWSSKQKFRQQKQYLQALQDRQRHEQSALSQRQGSASLIDSPRRQNLQLQRFRREQGALQQRLQMQRRNWPYRR